MHPLYLTENPDVCLKKLPSRATKNTINSPDSSLTFYQVTVQKVLSSILIYNQHSLTFVHTCTWKIIQINSLQVKPVLIIKMHPHQLLLLSTQNTAKLNSSPQKVYNHKSNNQIKINHSHRIPGWKGSQGKSGPNLPIKSTV